MVAPSDPKGINRAGSPRDINRALDSSWGFVMDRTERRRKLIGLGVLIALVLLVVVAFLMHRLGGDNFGEVRAGEFFRAAQMDETALVATIRRHGIRTVLRLVGTGESNRAGYEANLAAAQVTGARLIVAKLPTSRLPWREELLAVFDALDDIAADPALLPVLVHCSMGSDRTGLVSAIWLHDYRGVPLNDARRQMAFFPYMHVSFGAAGELRRVLDMYEEHLAAHPGTRPGIGDWARAHYFESRDGRAVTSRP
jgi:hypothetical protein